MSVRPDVLPEVRTSKDMKEVALCFSFVSS
jgi:hypothetical protein